MNDGVSFPPWFHFLPASLISTLAIFFCCRIIKAAISLHSCGLVKSGALIEINSHVGDAPVHTLAVAMMLPTNETHWFRDIGYQHEINIHCPPESSASCSCEPTDIDTGFHALVSVSKHPYGW